MFLSVKAGATGVSLGGVYVDGSRGLRVCGSTSVCFHANQNGGDRPLYSLERTVASIQCRLVRGSVFGDNFRRVGLVVVHGDEAQGALRLSRLMLEYHRNRSR
jgi:hypothetical protein